MSIAIFTLAALLAVSNATSAHEAIIYLTQAVQASSDEARHSEVEERAPTEQEELALAAMEGLMSQPAERALPIIRKVLAGSQTTLIKQRALFVLSQLDSPEAQQILLQTSRSTNAALRKEAIRSIGIGGNRKSLDALQEIYDAGNAGTKADVLEAWLIAEHKEAVYQAALNAKSEDEARAAIDALGAMGAVDELRKLGNRPNPSRRLVDAYGVSGDLASRRRIAEGSGDQSQRLAAVRNMGIVENDAARAALREIYSRSTDPDMKEAALDGMLTAQDEQGLLALYKAAKTADEKRKLLRTLTAIDGDAALDAIDAALEGRE
jgi:hypothetical protein